MSENQKTNERPGNWCGYDDMAFEFCTSLVPDQKASANGPEGEKYEAKCVQVGDHGITAFEKNGTIIATRIYNYETQVEIIDYASRETKGEADRK